MGFIAACHRVSICNIMSVPYVEATEPDTPYFSLYPYYIENSSIYKHLSITLTVFIIWPRYFMGCIAACHRLSMCNIKSVPYVEPT